MQINPDLIYKIGQGGLIEGKLIFIHPHKIKKRPWVARCSKKKNDQTIERQFLEGWREEYDDNHYLIEFDLMPFEVYQYGNIYLGPTLEDELYKSYAMVSDEEFVEIEMESVFVFMNIYKGKNKRGKAPPVHTNYIPEDIDF